MKSVYCVVRTGSLNKAVCASYLKVKMVLSDTGLVAAGWADMFLDRSKWKELVLK
jgi:hypothetical protein